MIFMGNARPTFTPAVGVAPATTTISIPGPDNGLGVVYSPYTSIEDLRAASSSSGLGLINETDAWLTGRPYGLPGTAAIKFDSSEPYGAGMLGGTMGEFNPTDVSAIVSAQREQAAALKRVAFWQTVWGATALASLGLAIGTMIWDRVK